MLSPHRFLHPARDKQSARRGSILVLAAAALIMILGFAAFAVDIGYITLTRSQLQNAADASALAAAQELVDGLGGGMAASAVAAKAGSAAVSVAAANRAGDLNSVYVNTASDVTLGKRSWDPIAGSWVTTWGAAPYNIVKVNVRRSKAGTGDSSNTAGDQPLPLFLAPVIGHDTASIDVDATAGLLPASGFRIHEGSSATADVLPIAYDLPSWEALQAGIGDDKYSYNPATGAITSGPDGILELDLYPYSNKSLTPGNRGTVDLGNPNNSTSDLKRQILYGLNAADLAYFGGELRTDQGPLSINGDTGLSAGIKSALESIKGQPRAIPIFTSVSGPGNNAQYTIVKFVGIRILEVVLTGGSKRVIAQPAVLIDRTSFTGSGTTGNDYIYSPVRLIE